MLPEENVVQDDDFTEVEVTQKEEETKESTDVSSSQPSAEPAEKEEELEQYSTKVQKRIDKLTRKLRDSERKEQAAADFAKMFIMKTNSYVIVLKQWTLAFYLNTKIVLRRKKLKLNKLIKKHFKVMIQKKWQMLKVYCQK